MTTAVTDSLLERSEALERRYDETGHTDWAELSALRSERQDALADADDVKWLTGRVERRQEQEEATVALARVSFDINASTSMREARKPLDQSVVELRGVEDEGAWNAALDKFERARDAFVDAARKEVS